MKDSFDTAIKYVLRYEGGYVNHPLDPGGETNMGITKNTLNRANNENLVKTTNMKNLSVEEAKLIYKKYYWDPYKLDEIDNPIDTIMFDMIVNHGSRNAIKMIQRSLNELKLLVDVDGIVGPKTLNAIKDACKRDKTKFANTILITRKKFYDDIVSNKPSQIVFLKGWYNRIKNLCKDLGLSSVI